MGKEDEDVIRTRVLHYCCNITKPYLVVQEPIKPYRTRRPRAAGSRTSRRPWWSGWRRSCHRTLAGTCKPRKPEKSPPRPHRGQCSRSFPSWQTEFTFTSQVWSVKPLKATQKGLVNNPGLLLERSSSSLWPQGLELSLVCGRLGILTKSLTLRTKENWDRLSLGSWSWCKQCDLKQVL